MLRTSCNLNLPRINSRLAITILDVENSYKRAIADGRLLPTRLPLLVKEKDDGRKPYALAIHALPRAFLDANKVEDIIQRVYLTTQIVPTAVEWIAKTEEYNLTEKSLELVLRNAFDYDELLLGQRSKGIGTCGTGSEAC